MASGLRSAAGGAANMEEAAQGVVGQLFAGLVDGDGSPACALVRLYVTSRLGELQAPLQELAAAAVPDGMAALTDETRCLTLLATAGREPAWNDRRASEHHQVIALSDEEGVERLPMVAGLLRGLGIEASAVVRPDPRQATVRSGRRYDLFFVPEAAGSPLVPDGAFVARHGIRSTVGFGGVLPSGELFAVVIFARVALTAAVAELLRSLALTVQALVVPHTYRVFAPPGS